MAIDTANKFKVVATIGGAVQLAPIAGDLTREDALNLAAWLVYVADPDGEHFQTVLGSVMTDHG